MISFPISLFKERKVQRTFNSPIFLFLPVLFSLDSSEVSEELERHEYDSEGDNDEDNEESRGQQQHFNSISKSHSAAPRDPLIKRLRE